MRRAFTSLLLTAALAVAAHSPPAAAQSGANGCYKITEDPATRICAQMRLVGFNTARGFTVRFDADGTWSGADLVFGPTPNLTDRLLLKGDMSQFFGGQTLGGTYQAPNSARAAGNMEIDWYRYQTEWGIGLRRIERDELVAGGAFIGGPAGSPTTGWYVPQLVNADGSFGQREDGTGVFVEYQGDKLRLMIASYAADGNPRWYSVTSACVVNSAGTCTYTGAVTDPQLGALSETATVVVSGGQINFTLSQHPLDTGVRRILVAQTF